MVSRWQYRFLTIAAALIVVLAIINATLFVGNRRIQATVNNRQQYIQQSIQLEGLYTEIVKSLADLSAKQNDEQLRDLLKTHGFTITVNPVASSSPR
jgi:ABC-type transport system involved in cytochrome bd biosynthesis fused ATPase/permease subunit